MNPGRRTCSAELSIRPSSGDPHDAEAAVSELLQLTGMNLARTAGDYVNLAIRPTVPSEQPPEQPRDIMFAGPEGKSTIYLQIAGQLQFRRKSTAAHSSEEFDLEWDARQLLEETINDLLVCMVVAHPGKFDIGSFEIEPMRSHGGEFKWDGFSPRIQNCLGPAVQTARSIGWPPLKNLELRQVYDWARRLPGWGRGVSGNNVDTAFAALMSVLCLEPGEPVLALVWALVGLEALYTSANMRTRKQMLDGAEGLLGRCSANRSLFSAMYRVRSRFLHGGLPVAYTYRDTDLDEYADSMFRALMQSRELATALLLASLHELIDRGWTSMEMATSAVRP